MLTSSLASSIIVASKEIIITNCPCECEKCSQFFEDSLGVGVRIICKHICHNKGLGRAEVPAHSVPQPSSRHEYAQVGEINAAKRK